jgi:Holliday junction resolvase
VTLSDKALAMMNGSEVKEVAPTYVRPTTSRSILSQSEASKAKQAANAKESNVIGNRFSEMMQNILDKRLGIDRERLEELEELEALMEEIANNENMSPEEKELALEKLAEMREIIIEEGREIQEVVKQTD